MFGLGDAFKKPEGSWDCDTCFVQNKAADVKCVACQTPKPGATVESNGKKKTNKLLSSQMLLIIKITHIL